MPASPTTPRPMSLWQTIRSDTTATQSDIAQPSEISQASASGPGHSDIAQPAFTKSCLPSWWEVHGAYWKLPTKMLYYKHDLVEKEHCCQFASLEWWGHVEAPLNIKWGLAFLNAHIFSPEKS